jgi:hypothetical protein
MEYLIPLMPLLGTLPIAVAAVIVARLWFGRRDVPLAELEARSQELKAGLDVVQTELHEVQERLDFAERVLAQQRRDEQLLPRDRTSQAPD